MGDTGGPGGTSTTLALPPCLRPMADLRPHGRGATSWLLRERRCLSRQVDLDVAPSGCPQVYWRTRPLKVDGAAVPA